VMKKDFDSLDKDKSGFIKGKELEALVNMQLGRKATADEIRVVGSMFDTNEDGQISLKEWEAFVFQPTAAANDDEVRNLTDDFHLTKEVIEQDTKIAEARHAQAMEVRAMCQMLAKFNKKKGFYEQDTKAAKKAFQKQAAKDGKVGSISPSEFRDVLKTMSFSEVQINEIWDTMDLNNNDDIDFNEFKKAFDHYERFAAMMKTLVPIVVGKGSLNLADAEKKAKASFLNIKEIHDDDLLTPDEFDGWLKDLKIKSTASDVESMFMVLDADGSDRVRCGEFVTTICLQWEDGTSNYKFDQNAAKGAAATPANATTVKK